MKGIDADPSAANLDHLPGIGELAPCVLASRQIDGAARLVAAEHTAGIGAVRGDEFATGETNVSEKTLVTAHERAADQCRSKAHSHL